MTQPLMAGKCGLYCGVCTDFTLEKVCRGCGCNCATCAAHWHHQTCAIYRCAEEKGFDTCADCLEMPCSRLIQFAADPVWTTHVPVIENLRRIARIGLDLWLEEQEEFWSDPTEREKAERHHQECGERWQELSGEEG
jgi:hypothetical protein